MCGHSFQYCEQLFSLKNGTYFKFLQILIPEPHNWINDTWYSIINLKLKGTVSRDFLLQVFSRLFFSQAPENKVHHLYQRHRLQFSTNIVDTGGKFAKSIKDTGGKFATATTGVVDTSGKFATGVKDIGGKLVSTTPLEKFATGVNDTSGK